ncbi:hypothetical protein FA15DRAFT_676067 [Coprinopsis marcescibilis]|uniref:Peptidase M43 pregnancy-associated plasma-A domain-containing protein n=1 Tax=Coprinopsis marcescibilis TaxID=230819 RepID=A0A5C3KBJ7_COPMA|nr:hypothetical protein FA15DRAFT_676067 [Coprinopsis marcescibilis]
MRFQLAAILTLSASLAHVNALIPVFPQHSFNNGQEGGNSGNRTLDVDGFDRPEVGCGNIPDHQQVNKRERSFRRMRQAHRTSGRKPEGVSFSVHWNVVAADERPEKGWLEDWQIRKSMEIINEDFAPVGVRFELSGVNYHKNPEWYGRGVMNDLPFDQQMKPTMHVGDNRMINIFTLGDGPGGKRGFLGYSTFPGGDLGQDGIILNHNALYDGNWDGSNLGHVLTHEIGHWLGLYHTFQDGGSCSGAGDQVGDTQIHKEASWKCNSQAPSTCGAKDPVFNYMNYVDDACRREFTQGQIDRMWDHIELYRS